MGRFIGTNTAGVELFFQHIHLRKWDICHLMGPTFVSLCRRSLPPGIGTSLFQNTVHITFRADIVCLNFVLQGDPLWRQFIDCCLFSEVTCATCDDPVLKLVAVIMVTLQKSQCWLHALCFVFWCQLVCSVHSKLLHRPRFTVCGSWNKSHYLQPL